MRFLFLHYAVRGCKAETLHRTEIVAAETAYYNLYSLHLLTSTDVSALEAICAVRQCKGNLFNALALLHLDSELSMSGRAISRLWQIESTGNRVSQNSSVRQKLVR